MHLLLPSCSESLAHDSLATDIELPSVILHEGGGGRILVGQSDSVLKMTFGVGHYCTVLLPP